MDIAEHELLVENCVFTGVISDSGLFRTSSIFKFDEGIHFAKRVCVFDELCLNDGNLHLALFVQRMLFMISFLRRQVRLLPDVLPLQHDYSCLFIFLEYFVSCRLLLCALHEGRVRDGLGLSQRVGSSSIFIHGLHDQLPSLIDLFELEHLCKTCLLASILVSLRSVLCAVVDKAGERVLFAEGITVVLQEIGFCNLKLNVTVRVHLLVRHI